MAPTLQTALMRCIRLREQVRDALDGNDLVEVCRLNRLADDAYLALSPQEQGAYCAWAFGEST